MAVRSEPVRKFKISDVAKMLDVHTRTTWRWILDGVGGRQLRTIRIGGRRWVLEEDLQAFLADDGTQEPRPTPPPQQRSANDARRLDELLGRQPSDRRRQ
jgi:hypothetical protein